MDGAKGFQPSRKTETFEQSRGQGLRYIAFLLLQLFEQSPDDAPQPARGQLRAPGGRPSQKFIHGNDAAYLERDKLRLRRIRSRQDLKLRLDHLELACRGTGRFKLAVKGYHLPGAKLVFQITSVKPHALYSVQALPDGHLEDRHRTGAQQCGAAYFAYDRSHAAGLQLSNRPR